jgi:NAD(P)-dependent dehydrogenase (short-subunit alcohol dehydrogenase family)
MAKRLAGKTAIIVGGGQQPGETVGNGRATAITFAREGAKLLLVDISEMQAKETLSMIEKEQGKEFAGGWILTADITREADCKAIAQTCVDHFGRIDILHNNVGRSRGDKSTYEMDAAMWDEIMAMNLKGMFMTIKHVLPIMRAQQSGSIVNISSTSSYASRQTVTYRTSKGAVNTLTQHVAAENADHGVRCNAILPGLMDTPMAIERRVKERNVTREVVRRERDSQVPLLGKMGSGWDVANAALFLASDEARFVTGVLLPVDGGMLVKRG